jgi:hypothetical protein
MAITYQAEKLRPTAGLTTGASRSCWQGWTGASIGRTDCGLIREAGGGAHPYRGDQLRRLGGTPLTPQKKETVNLVIYGCFWLFLFQILVATRWHTTT